MAQQQQEQYALMMQRHGIKLEDNKKINEPQPIEQNQVEINAEEFEIPEPQELKIIKDTAESISNCYNAPVNVKDKEDARKNFIRSVSNLGFTDATKAGAGFDAF